MKNFADRVNYYLTEKTKVREEAGYKGLATRLSKELGKEINSSQVKSYLKKKEAELKKAGKWKYIQKGAEKASAPGAYKYGTHGSIYMMLKNHFEG